MLIINNEIDLSKSFEKLKQELKEAANGVKTRTPKSYSYHFGRLEAAVKIHLIACTDIDMKAIQDYINEDDSEDNQKVNILSGR